MANAHAHRHRVGKGKPCSTDCIYCKSNNTQRVAKGQARMKNRSGHRHNPGK